LASLDTVGGGAFVRCKTGVPNLSFVSMSATKSFSKEEIAKHNKAGDLWMTLHGKVYDVSSFMEDHPGGPEILMGVGGKDATQDFEDVFHSEKARSMAEKYLIGDVEGYSSKGTSLANPHGDKTASASSSGSKATSNGINIIYYILALLIVAGAIAFALLKQ